VSGRGSVSGIREREGIRGREPATNRWGVTEFGFLESSYFIRLLGAVEELRPRTGARGASLRARPRPPLRGPNRDGCLSKGETPMLQIYPVILSFVADVAELTPRIAHHDPDLARQLRRASSAVALTPPKRCTRGGAPAPLVSTSRCAKCASVTPSSKCRCSCAICLHFVRSSMIAFSASSERCTGYRSRSRSPRGSKTGRRETASRRLACATSR
jgi:hypothetical protein